MGHSLVDGLLSVQDIYACGDKLPSNQILCGIFAHAASGNLLPVSRGLSHSMQVYTHSLGTQVSGTGAGWKPSQSQLSGWNLYLLTFFNR
jgi:hypothetical protein